MGWDGMGWDGMGGGQKFKIICKSERQTDRQTEGGKKRQRERERWRGRGVGGEGAETKTERDTHTESIIKLIACCTMHFTGNILKSEKLEFPSLVLGEIFFQQITIFTTHSRSKSSGNPHYRPLLIRCLCVLFVLHIIAGIGKTRSKANYSYLGNESAVTVASSVLSQQ